MIALQPADLVLIAGRTLNLDTEAVLDLLDHTAAEAALAEAAPGTEDPAQAAAALLHTLVHRPFLARGNDMVALMATTQFLALNGFQIDLDPPETTRTVIADLAAGRLDPGELADWLAPRLTPRAGQVSCDRPPSLLSRLTTRRRRRAKPARDRFHRFTDRARTVMVLAQEEARRLGHEYLGTEHLLLGLLAESQGVAAKALQVLDISSDTARSQVEQVLGPGRGTPGGHIPFTPRAKRAVFEGAMREAMLLGHNYIGTEHLLLGLLREGEGVAAMVLTNLGAGHERTREQVLQLLAGPRRTAAEPPELQDYTEQIAQVRREKNTAVDRADFDTAAALREVEQRLLTEKNHVTSLLAANADTIAMIKELHHLRGEVERLRAQLVRYGIQPDDQRPPAAQAGP